MRCLFCVFPCSLVQLGAVSCHPLVFLAKEIVQNQSEIHVILKVFPNIAIALEQIYIFFFKVKHYSRSDCICIFRCQCFRSYGLDFQDREIDGLKNLCLCLCPFVCFGGGFLLLVVVVSDGLLTYCQIVCQKVLTILRYFLFLRP